MGAAGTQGRGPGQTADWTASVPLTALGDNPKHLIIYRKMLPNSVRFLREDGTKLEEKLQSSTLWLYLHSRLNISET